jgi:hypothetical protein
LRYTLSSSQDEDEGDALLDLEDEDDEDEEDIEDDQSDFASVDELEGARYSRLTSPI